MQGPTSRVAVVLLGWLAACGGPAGEGGQGAACFRASECAAGLVCIAQTCTSDLTSINLHEDAGAAGGAMMVPAGDASAAGGGSGAGGAPAAGGSSGSGGAGGSSGGKAGAGGSAGRGGSGGSAGGGMAGMSGSMAGMSGAGNVNDASAD